MIKKEPVLVCDSCGAEKRLGQVDVANATARRKAASEGWGFMSYSGLQISGETRARLWDTCPDCELPETSEVIDRIRIEDSRRLQKAS